MPAGTNYCKCHPEIYRNSSPPLFRLICHCKTCQEYLSAEFNDECTFFLKDCPEIKLEEIEFKSYQSRYLPIKRGKCKTCGKVACCIAKLGPVTLFVMIPSAMLDTANLPEPIAHIYYDRRVNETADQIQKISGHLPSQMTILMAILKSFKA